MVERNRHLWGVDNIQGVDWHRLASTGVDWRRWGGLVGHHKSLAQFFTRSVVIVGIPCRRHNESVPSRFSKTGGGETNRVVDRER